MKAADIFAFHDDVKYTKKGWINRNRIARATEIYPFTLPLLRAADSALISERVISPTYDPDRQLRILESAYRNSRFWDECKAIISPLLYPEDPSLSKHLMFTLQSIAVALDIPVHFSQSSRFQLGTDLRGADRVIGICGALGASSYLNPAGGAHLYDAERFRENSLGLHFLHVKDDSTETDSTADSYRSAQGSAGRLSIIHSLANNGIEGTRRIVEDSYYIECQGN